MAEDNAVVSPVSSPVVSVPTESHKRKHEELELNEVPEDLDESEDKSDGELVSSGPREEENGRGDESENKRPHLDTNGGEVNDAADGMIDGLSVPAEVPFERRDSEDENGRNLDVQESSETVHQVLSSDNIEKEKCEDEGAGDFEKPEAPDEENSQEFQREGNASPSELPEGSDEEILTHRMEVPNAKVGVLIGKAGDTVRSLQENSGAKIQIMRAADADPRSSTRPVEIVGNRESIKKAQKLIKDVIAEADAGGSPSLVARGFSTVQAASGGEQLEMRVPSEKVGIIIGKGGETIRSLQTRSGARIQLLQQNPSDGDQSKEKTVRLSGTKEQIDIAREMIEDVMNQNTRQPSHSGMYNQPGYRPRGPSAPLWGPRGPPHSPYGGYDYPQRGPYSAPYPPSSYGTPRGGSFGPSWDHRPPSGMHGGGGRYYQGNYNYGHQQGPDYGAPPPYSHTPSQPYGQVYNDAKYDHHASSQHYGHMGGSQPAPYSQGGGYAHQDQYGSRPPMYNMQQQQGPPLPPHSQPYGPPRPGDVASYAGPPPVSSTQSYGHAMPPPQPQPYPYASGTMQQQTYAAYGGSTLPTDGSGGYSHIPSASSSYPQGGGYGSSTMPQQQAAAAYPQAAVAAGYASYSEQPAAAAAANTVVHGYQGTAPTSYPTAAAATTTNSAQGYQGTPTATYQAAATTNAAAYGYQATYPQASQPQQQQPSYDQSGGYGNASVGKSMSPQSGSAAAAAVGGAYPQYDSSQAYATTR